MAKRPADSPGVTVPGQTARKRGARSPTSEEPTVVIAGPSRAEQSSDASPSSAFPSGSSPAPRDSGDTTASASYPRQSLSPDAQNLLTRFAETETYVPSIARAYVEAIRANDGRRMAMRLAHLTSTLDACLEEEATPSDDAASEELRSALTDLSSTQIPASNPIVAFFCLAEAADEAPAARAPLSADDYVQTKVLQSHFYEAEYLGEHNKNLFRCLQRLEDQIQEEWSRKTPSLTSSPSTSSTSTQASEEEENRQFYARSIPIVQSSGMGKSRLLRELGKVGSAEDDWEVIVLCLCLRKDYPGSAACVPAPDIAPRDYLNERQVVPSGLAAKAWTIKAQIWLTTLWLHLVGLISADNGRARLRLLCDPATEKKRQDRHVFLEETVKASRPKLTLALSKVKDEIDQTSHPNEAYDNAIAESALEAHNAARRLMGALGAKDWFILGIDEASGLCPAHLRGSRLPNLVTDVDVSRECLAIVTRMFSKPHPNLGSTCRIKTARPARFWLALTDTNASISTLVPPQSESQSARLVNDEMKRVPPCCPIILNVQMHSSEAVNELLQMTPLEAASEHNLARTGRPMWQSLLSIDDSCPSPLHVDPDDSYHQEEFDEIRQHRVRCFANPEFVLDKLLGPRHNKTGQWLMDRQHYMALLFQRLDLNTTHSKTLTDKQRVDARKFQEDWVHYHLGGLRSAPHDGLEIEVLALNEPLVTSAATGFFRSQGRDRFGRALRVNGSRAPLWRDGWSAFRSWASTGVPLDSGESGEIMGQAVFCIAHDQAKRPSWKGKKSRSECKAAYRGDSAIVHVEHLLQKLVSTPASKEMLDDLGSHAWVNYQRFSRASNYRFTRQDLIVAFWFRRAIVGAKGQKSWDFVIPVYCGALDQPFDPQSMTWMEVQVKTRRAKTRTFMTPQSTIYGNLLTADEKEGGTRPSDGFVPKTPPMLFWLEMSAAAERLETPQGPTLSAKWHNEKKYWMIDCPLFHQQNHPALDEIWPNEPFPLLLPSTGDDLATWGPEQQEHFDDALTESLYLSTC